MNTNHLKRFAQAARRQLLEQVGAKLAYVLRADSAELRERAAAIQSLREELDRLGKDQLIERVAYTWFNRLMALRFMDVNDYQPAGLRIVSPAEGHTQPQLLAEAKQGHFPDDMKVDRQRILDLLDGRLPSTNPENEAYRLLLIAACNALHQQFPFLFEAINDYTELLLPDDLISELSIVHAVVEGMPAEDCREVEIIGWLYQFYISEKKDEVFAGKGKVKKEDIPAATQLFTPRWIVEYMVQNTLGKLWLQNRPQSRLREHMPYFIESPSLEAEEYLRVESPEEIRLLDQACGSGHILVYAFELLTRIYEEEGYATSEIPGLILAHNLYGFEIDERAAQLAGFVLLMKARGYYRRFFRKEAPEPKVLCFADVRFSEEEMERALSLLDQTGSAEVKHDLLLLEQATNLGSLIQPHAPASIWEKGITVVKERFAQSGVFERPILERLNHALRQLQPLSQRYHCVVDNPPYMGSGNMNKPLSDFVKAHYPDSKADLMAAFMEAGLAALLPRGFLGMINQHSWMFLSSYEKLRDKLINNTFFDTLLHLGPRTFPEIAGEVVQNAAFTFWDGESGAKGSYVRLVDFDRAELKHTQTLTAIQDPNCGWFYTADQQDFAKIPGSPIGYWLSEFSLRLFDEESSLIDISKPRSGMSTTNNIRFLRSWYEVSEKNIGYEFASEREFLQSGMKWNAYNRGGGLRWSSELENVINWQNGGEEIKTWVVNNPKDPKTTHWSRRIFNTEFFFLPGVSWGDISSSKISCKKLPQGYIFDSVGIGLYNLEENEDYVLALMNSIVAREYLNLLCPTLHFNPGGVGKLPIVISKSRKEGISRLAKLSTTITQKYLHAYEASFFYRSIYLIQSKCQDLEESYDLYRQYWTLQFRQLHQNEEALNREFIHIYGLAEELTPDVPLAEITILQQELDAKKLAALSKKYRSGWELIDGQWQLPQQRPYPKLPFDAQEVMAQFVSYAVGCMMGRYSLDKEGLMLANQGEGMADYVRKVSGDWWGVDGNGEWSIDENKNVYEHYPELQRTTNLAAEHATGQDRLSGHERNVEGRTIRADQSDQIPVDSRSGNDADEKGRTASGRDHESEKTDSRPQQQTPLTTHHPPITFWPDEDAIIPVLDDEWFEDDIVGQFYRFLRVSFGERDFARNLAFLEAQLGKDIRKYFVKDFYKDHVKRYKMRPIYWLFSSPAGHFQVLVYLHRYTPDTINLILNNYLREFIQKLKAQRAHYQQLESSGTTTEQNQATKRIDQLDKMLLDCEAYERDILYPLATERIALDLDDGVLVNYNKLGKAVLEVKGLNDKKKKQKVRGFDWIDVSEIRG